MRLSVKTKISIATLVISLLCSAFIGLFSYIIFKNNLEEYMGKRALDVAYTISAEVDGDAIERYDKTETIDSEYQSLLDYLSDVKSKTKLTYIYIIAEQEDNYKYIAEGIVDGETPSLLGDTEDKDSYGSEPEEVLQTGAGKYTDVYTNGDWGDLISGFAPIKNSGNKVVGIVALDIGTDIIRESMRQYVVVLLAIVAGSCIILFTFIYIIFSKIVVNPIKILGESSLKLSRGDFEIAMSNHFLKKNDEIGDLAKSFVSMSSNMKNITKDISYVLTEMANRNLSVRITNEYVGDYQPIKNSINHILESYNDLLVQFACVASELSSGSKLVADISQTLSEGTSNQASATEELSSSVTAFGENVKRNSKNAEMITEYTDESSASIMKCNQEMQNMLVAMNEIKSSSDEIADIIKIIDDISFQTNILALNASVEAARVGNAGKGFAVVANEVRNLASKTADAAQKTSDLIADSIKAIEKGINISELTAKALEIVTEKEKQVGTTVIDIADVSKEQNTALVEILQGIRQISEVVQKNSEISHECAAASEELSSQADILHGEIDQFNLKWPESSE